MKSPEQFNPYTAKKAEAEALKMQKKIKTGEAEDYVEAERIVENEAKIKDIQKALMHPTYIGRRDEGDYRHGHRGGDLNDDLETLLAARIPGKLVGLYVDYEYIGRVKKEIDNGANILLVGGEIYSSVGSSDFPERKKPSYEDTVSDPGKNKLVHEAFDKKLSNAIRIEPTGKEIDCVSEDVENKIKEYLGGGKSILDALKDLEKQNLIKIGHIPDFYTDKEALKDRYNLEFSTRKELDKFLESEFGKSADPERVLERAKYLDGDTIKFLLEKYQDKIDLAKVISFGSGGIVQNLEQSDKMEIFEKVVSILEKRTDKNIERVEEHRKSWRHEHPAMRGTFEPGLTKEEDMNIKSRLNFLSSAAAQGLILPDYKDRIKKINSVIDYIPSGYYVDRVISRMRKDIEEVALLLEKLSNEKKITGKGLEFVNSEYTQGKQVYLDGELIGSFDNAEFSEKPTNGEVVAWVTHEVIDRNNITGTQNRDIAYAWKKGVGTKEIFEDHAWSSERYLRVSAPKVDSDGTIKIEVTSGDKTEKKDFKI